MQTTHEISAEIVRHWDELSRDGVINREETIRQIIEQLPEHGRSFHNDTDLSDAEVIAKISDLTLEIKPDVDSDSAGTVICRVEAAVELAKQNASNARNLATAHRFIANLRKAVRRAGDVFGTTESNHEKSEYYERVLQENNPA